MFNMKLIGFSLNKISIEKLSENQGEFKVNTNINITEIKEVKADFFKSKENLLGIQFIYTIDYSPNFAKIAFEGNILISIEPKESREILSKWKDKKLPEEIRIILFNIIFRKCNVKALQLEEEMNIPLHVPMPVLKNQEDEDR